jgi:hypothetical protein
MLVVNPHSFFEDLQANQEETALREVQEGMVEMGGMVHKGPEVCIQSSNIYKNCVVILCIFTYKNARLICWNVKKVMMDYHVSIIYSLAYRINAYIHHVIHTHNAYIKVLRKTQENQIFELKLPMLIFSIAFLFLYSFR